MQNKTTRVTKEPGNKAVNLTVHQLILRTIDRYKKDVDDWRIAHRMAEAVNIPTRRRLYDVYEDVVLDAHLSGVWKKRVSAVLNKRLMFTKNGVEDPAFDALLKSRAFRRLRKKLMAVHSWGIVGLEFVPGKEFNFEEIPRKHIRPERKLITIEPDGDTGFPYEENPYIWVVENEDEPFGFLLKASPYALFKKGNWADWAQFVEIFGQPVIITKYDGHDEATRIALSSAMEEAGSSLRLMLPKQAEFEMMDGKTSNGDGRLQQTFLNSLNNEISVLVLGNTETTGNDNGGSLAKGEVHAKQQLMITRDDCAEELIFLNDPLFLRALQTYGYKTEGGEFKYEDEVDTSSLEAELRIDQGLKSIGLPLSHDYFYEKYHRPKPTGSDPKINDNPPPAPAAPPPPPPPPASGENPEQQLTQMLKGMSFWDKVKAVFSDAP